MGLLDSLKSTFNSSGEASVPPAASFATREGVIYAPVNGVLVNLNEIPDETIASGMLGQGYGLSLIHISELDRLKSIDHVGESGTLIGGNPLVKLGDPLLVAKTK